MLNYKASYPYPLVRPTAIDYKKTIFAGDFEVEPVSDGYAIKPSFFINNNHLKELIDSEIIGYALQINCNSTWFRSLIEVKNNQMIKISSALVRGRVDICPCIISYEKIECFSDSDFSGYYSGRAYNIPSKSVLGIGIERSFTANYKEDIIKDASSIIEVKGDSKAKFMDMDFGDHLILVTLPHDQFELYKDIGVTGNTGAIGVFNSIVAIPALIQGIDIISREDDPNSINSEHSGNAWYQSLKIIMEEKAEHDISKYHDLLAHPVRTAQQILNNNSETVMNYVKIKEGII